MSRTAKPKITRGSSRRPGTRLGALGALTGYQRILVGVALGLSALAGVLSVAGAGAVLVCAWRARRWRCSPRSSARPPISWARASGPARPVSCNRRSAICRNSSSASSRCALGLVAVVQAALVGSILGNSLLVLGLAFLVGGLRHGAQRFAPSAAHDGTLLRWRSPRWRCPRCRSRSAYPGQRHTEGLSIACAISCWSSSSPASPSRWRVGHPPCPTKPRRPRAPIWPLWLAVVLLVFAGVGAAFVSDWFVAALTARDTVLTSPPRSPAW